MTAVQVGVCRRAVQQNAVGTVDFVKFRIAGGEKFTVLFKGFFRIGGIRAGIFYRDRFVVKDVFAADIYVFGIGKDQLVYSQFPVFRGQNKVFRLCVYSDGHRQRLRCRQRRIIALFIFRSYNEVGTGFQRRRYFVQKSVYRIIGIGRL